MIRCVCIYTDLIITWVSRSDARDTLTREPAPGSGCHCPWNHVWTWVQTLAGAGPSETYLHLCDMTHWNIFKWFGAALAQPLPHLCVHSMHKMHCVWSSLHRFSGANLWVWRQVVKVKDIFFDQRFLHLIKHRRNLRKKNLDLTALYDVTGLKLHSIKTHAHHRLLAVRTLSSDSVIVVKGVIFHRQNMSVFWLQWRPLCQPHSATPPP